MDERIKDPTGTLPGKNIIFAISKAHALFDLLYPQHKGKLVRVIVSDDKRVHGIGGLLDQFKKKSFPRIAVSVDMLDTGVNIPEVVNLVVAKPVFAYTKFWQPIGRGRGWSCRTLSNRVEDGGALPVPKAHEVAPKLSANDEIHPFARSQAAEPVASGREEERGLEVNLEIVDGK